MCIKSRIAGSSAMDLSGSMATISASRTDVPVLGATPVMANAWMGLFVGLQIDLVESRHHLFAQQLYGAHYVLVG